MGLGTSSLPGGACYRSSPAPRVRLTSGAADIYRAKVADLEASLNAREIRAEAAEALRSLIERVVLTPDPTAADGLAAMLHAELATILSLASGAQIDKLPSTFVLVSQLSVFAGTGFEPVTFRL
jgi:site-specific DNA recombinase